MGEKKRMESAGENDKRVTGRANKEEAAIRLRRFEKGLCILPWDPLARGRHV